MQARSTHGNPDAGRAATRRFARRPKQKDRVLSVLHLRGPAGTSGLEWAKCPPDGGSPVIQLPGVVRQLRRDGHAIRSSNVQSVFGTTYTRYTLVPPGTEDEQ